MPGPEKVLRDSPPLEVGFGRQSQGERLRWHYGRRYPKTVEKGAKKSEKMWRTRVTQCDVHNDVHKLFWFIKIKQLSTSSIGVLHHHTGIWIIYFASYSKVCDTDGNCGHIWENCGKGSNFSNAFPKLHWISWMFGCIAKVFWCNHLQSFRFMQGQKRTAIWTLDHVWPCSAHEGLLTYILWFNDTSHRTSY